MAFTLAFVLVACAKLQSYPIPKDKWQSPRQQILGVWETVRYPYDGQPAGEKFFWQFREDGTLWRTKAGQIPPEKKWYYLINGKTLEIYFDRDQPANVIFPIRRLSDELLIIGEDEDGRLEFKRR
jgi:hypothetical protein